MKTLYLKPALAACGLALVLSATASSYAAATYSLSPPFDVEAVRTKVGKADRKPFTCKQPPAPMKDVRVESFYKKEDGSKSVVDPKAYAAYKKASKPASKFEIGLQANANRYVKSSPPRPDIAACDLDWLASWADGDALLGAVNKNGEYTRKWLLGSIASTWMQIRDEPSLDPEKKRRVTAWMRKVAEKAQADFSRDLHLKSRQNNHLYWAAWGVAAAGMALDDRAMFDWGVEKAREGINQIGPDGTLPHEIARGRRAYLYHLFAAMPLFMVAHAAEKNGVDLFAGNDAALRRLGEVALENLGNPEYFTDLTDEEQDLTHVGTSSDLGWVEIYRKHYDDKRADKALQDFRPMKHSRFGGNITLLYSEMNIASPKKDEKKDKRKI